MPHKSPPDYAPLTPSSPLFPPNSPMGNQHSGASSSDDDSPSGGTTRGKCPGGGRQHDVTARTTSNSNPNTGGKSDFVATFEPDEDEANDDEIVVTSNDPTASPERTYRDPSRIPPKPRVVVRGALPTPGKKAKKEKFTRSYKVDRAHVRAYDSQVVHNHGKILTPLDSAYDPAAAAAAALGAGESNNSMKVAARDFTASLKQIQGEDQPLVALSKTTHFDVATLRALRTVFTAISDMDAKDDLISARELCRATGAHPDSLLGRALFRLLDITRSNQINFRSWVLMLSRLSPAATLEEKIVFAFSLYDGDGDGYIGRDELVAMLRSVMVDLTPEDAEGMIAHAFDAVDHDGDRRIGLEEYKALAQGSHGFAESFTIDVQQLLAHYNVISADDIALRVHKLRERDQRQDERISGAPYVEREQRFMEKDEDDLKVVHDIDALDLD